MLLSVKEQYVLQIKNLVNENAYPPTGVADQTRNEIVMRYAMVVSVFDQLLCYDMPELHIFMRNGWIDHIDGLPKGMRYLVFDMDAK